MCFNNVQHGMGCLDLNLLHKNSFLNMLATCLAHCIVGL